MFLEIRKVTAEWKGSVQENSMGFKKKPHFFFRGYIMYPVQIRIILSVKEVASCGRNAQNSEEKLCACLK